MNKTTIANALLAVLVGSFMAVASPAFAESTIADRMHAATDSSGQKIDNTMNKIGNFMDDSTITAKVKAALVDNKIVKSTDISVETNKKVVTVAKGVEGVTWVHDRLHVRDSKKESAKGYAGDAATTAKVKAKLLADGTIPSRHISVETSDGVVQLSGIVESST